MSDRLEQRAEEQQASGAEPAGLQRSAPEAEPEGLAKGEAAGTGAAGDGQAAGASAASAPEAAGASAAGAPPPEGEPAAGEAAAAQQDAAGEGAPSAAQEAVPDWQAECERLAAELARAREERDQLEGMYRRLRADFDNFRRRKNEEVEKLKTTAAADLVRDLLPVMDNLERALAAAGNSEGPLATGIDMVLRQFRQILEGRGVTVIESVGQPFDPRWHEAVDYVRGVKDAQPGTVIEELRKGYRMGETLLRPSMVRVAGE